MVTRRSVIAAALVAIGAPSRPSEARTAAFDREGSSRMVRASWYRHGRLTASGEPFRPHGHTMAHKSLPFDTKVMLTNPHTDRSCIVRVNDRGPNVRGRECDVSLGVAEALGMKRAGVTSLRATILSIPPKG